MKLQKTMKPESIWSELGITGCAPFYRDPGYLAALLAGVVGLLFLRIVIPNISSYVVQLNMLVILNTIVLYPVLEEVLFRGVIQGQLIQKNWAKQTFSGFSYANWLTSLLFVGLHLFYHQPLWAISVILPSLLFGHFRDYYHSILPAIILHASFNLQLILVLA